MKVFHFVLFFGFALLSTSASAQTTDRELYEAAYAYLNDSILRHDYASTQELAKNCNHCCVKGIKLAFESELQVANRFINLTRHFSFKDYSQQHYDLSRRCRRALRMGTKGCKLVNHLLDSINTFWSDYEMKPEPQIAKELEGLASESKDGYQVFFSDVYKNTLAAEVKGFCSPYDKSPWFGSSRSFYFVFDKNGEIKKVYSGQMVIYN